MEKTMVTIMAAILFARNVLRRTYKDDAKFTAKMRRVNFPQRAFAYGGIICKYLDDATIATDGVGDWEQVAKSFQECGWNTDADTGELTTILRESWLEVLKGGYLPDELYGTMTMPEHVPPCDNCETDDETDEDA